MHLREYGALDFIARQGPCSMPSGAGLSTANDLLSRGWIVQRVFSPEPRRGRYAVTPEGLEALRAEKLRRGLNPRS